jgi:hypothetical protein
MKGRTALVVAAVLAIPMLVLAQDVKTDFDKSYDFTKLKTFYAKLATSWGNQLSEKRVMSDITDALVAKGWKVAPSESAADAEVMVHGATDVKKNLNTFYSGMGGGWGYGGWGGGGMATGTTTVSEYRVGTLVVDIFDAKTKNLVFRGTATDELSDKPEKNQKKGQKAAEKMFKDFPPGSKKK